MCALCARGTHALGLSWASVYVVHRPWPVLGALHLVCLHVWLLPMGLCMALFCASAIC